MKKILSNKKLIVILTITFILSLVLICFFNCPAYKTVRALKNGDIIKSTLHLPKVESALQRKLFSLLLPSTMEDINNSYNIGELSFDNVEELYKIVDSCEIIEVSEYQNEFIE